MTHLLPEATGQVRACGRTAGALSLLAGAAEEQSCVLVLPLPGDGPERVLLVAGPKEDVCDDAAVELGHALAAAAAAAFDHQATTLERQRAADQNAALARAAKNLNESPDLGTLLTRICDEAALLIGADSAVIYRVPEDEPDALSLEAAHGLPPEYLGYRLPAGEGLAGKVLIADHPMCTEDYARVGRPTPGSPWEHVEASIAVPVHWGGELRGVLSVAYRRPVSLGSGQLQALESFAELAAAAFTNAAIRAGLAEAARTDPLTGCLNHAALHDGLEREIERAERSLGTPLSLVLLDLDRFKEVNDEHGHLVGDEVLRRVGHALRSTTRPYDLAARYGGDEFALVAAEADEDVAREIAARAIERIGFGLGDLGGEHGPRATAGVAQWEPGLTAGDLIARADRALLYGKRANRRGEVLGERRAARHLPPRPRRAAQPPTRRSPRPAPCSPGSRTATTTRRPACAGARASSRSPAGSGPGSRR